MLKKSFVVFSFVLLAVCIFNLQMVGAAGNWATATSKISATVIELNQELSYNSEVEFNPVLANRGSDGSFIIEDAGSIELTSNIPWQLKAEAVNLPAGAEVYLRSTYSTGDQWVLLDSAPILSGIPGREIDISWDIKVVANDNNFNLDAFNVIFDLGWERN